jgi:uncharacterized protein (DUF1501 family)
VPQHINRRDFLRLAGLGGGAAMVSALGPGGRRVLAGGTPPNTALRTSTRLATTDVTSRVLVVIEMTGGNDGPSMAPPLDAGSLLALRPTAAHPEDAYLRPGGDLVLHPALERLQRRPLALVDGVGTATADLSHFEMLRRWWTGDPDGTLQPATGFLGRLCDALDEGAPVTGLSVGGASSPALISERAGTLGLPPLWWLWWLDAERDSWEGIFRDGLADMGAVDAADEMTPSRARHGIATGLRVGDLVGAMPDSDDGAANDGGYPETSLGENLALTAGVLAAGLGVRVVHVPFDADFDTHEGHRDRHDELMRDLDASLDAFLENLDAAGLADRVLVATTSEFGRRPEETGEGGLDHGTASTMLLAGPVDAIRLGEPVDYGRLDDDGNVAATISFDRYQATLAEWLGVPPGDVLDSAAEPLTGVW